MYAKDEANGLMAISLDDTGENVLRFGRMKYDGARGHFTPDSILCLRDFVSFPTKAKAAKAARAIGFTTGHVEKIGSRFWSCWGIRHDLRDCYFLAIFEYI